MKRKSRLLLPTLISVWALTISAKAEGPAEGAAEIKKPSLEEFLRFSENEDAGLLQTAIATYENADGVKVDAIGAVHIGDAEYYAELNKDFTAYDALLFEMVGGRDGLKKEDLQGGGPLHMLQGMMGKTLELDFQLEEVDYTPKNFVHADMDMATFAEKMGNQKLNLFALMRKVSEWERKRAAERKAAGIKEPDIGMAKVLQSLLFGGGEDLKLALGRQFGDLNSLMSEMDEEGAVIIGDRNEVALEVMDREIGKGKKSLGIFYGAAHLPDMEERLIKRGFKRTGVKWRNAWFVPKKDGVKRPGVEDEEKAGAAAGAAAE